jgi:hypothetical protein
MSLLLLWNAVGVTPTPPAPAVPLRDRFKIATPLRRPERIAQPELPVEPEVREPEAPIRRIGAPAAPAAPPWTPEPWPAPPPARAPEPTLPAEIEVLVTAPIPLGDDDDEEAIMLLLED